MRQREVERLVEKWRQRLCPGWRIVLEREAWDEDLAAECHAFVETEDEYAKARIWFRPESNKRPAWDVEITIVHELLHVALREVRDAADLLLPRVSSDIWQAHSKARNRAHEEFVDRLARVLVASEHDNWPTTYTLGYGRRRVKLPE